MTRYLADTSAWTNAGKSAESSVAWKRMVQTDQVVCCTPVQLELLRTTRNVDEFRLQRASLAAMHQVPVDQRTWDRALDVYELLAARGGSHHRQVPHADLLIASAAEQAGLTVLHYDHHFDVIAEVTGQPTQWIAPRGTL